MPVAIETHSRIETTMERIREYVRNMPLKNKILYASLVVIMMVSACIALVARYILVSSLTSELEQRGMGIAYSIADRSRGMILTQDRSDLISLVFEASHVGARRGLMAYVFILDDKNKVLASTFMHKFPKQLQGANPVALGAYNSIRLLDVAGRPVVDIAVPVKEGIYDVGSVHVGLSKDHIDSIVAKLRIAFLGFITFIVVIMAFISNLISRNITRPISQLIAMSNEISRDNLDFSINVGRRKVCWEVSGCEHLECPARQDSDVPCWYLDDTHCAQCSNSSFPEKLNECRLCEVFQQGAGDEVIQLADSFKNMVRHVKEYRSQIRKSQQKYRSLFHSGPDPIFVLDFESHLVLDANPMASDVYGFHRKQLVGMRFEELSPDFSESSKSLYEVGPEESQALCVFTPKVLHYRSSGSSSLEDKEPFYVHMHACATTYEDRPAIIVSTNDVTDMIEKDAQLIQASKMKSLGEMSAGMAHELNQPLNAIKIGSEYLNLVVDRGEMDEAQLSKVVQEISRQVDRAAEIITTLREFGRKADFSKERLDINKPVRGVLNILGQQLALKSIDLHLDMKNDLPRILAHNNRLEQVLFNLVNNAADAVLSKGAKSAAERRICIRTAQKGDFVSLSVEDTGTGISEKSKDKIFEPFYTTKETGKGMGLGLAISYEIVKDYNGEISVDSVEGKGTTFNLVFPVAT